MKVKWRLWKKTLPKQQFEGQKKNDWCKQSHLILIFTLSTIAFSSNLDGEFVFDDHVAVANNPALDSIFLIFTSDYWGHPIRSSQSHKSYRPITSITFAFNRFFSGQKTTYYHVTNILLHSAVTAMVYKVTKRLLQIFLDEDNGKNISDNIALYTSLLFAVHPIHSEAVANIAGRAELLMSLAFFILLDNYLEGMQMGFSGVKMSLIFFLSILSLFSKEQGIIALRRAGNMKNPSTKWYTAAGNGTIFIWLKKQLALIGQEVWYFIKSPTCIFVELLALVQSVKKSSVKPYSVFIRLFLCAVLTLILILFRLYINGFTGPNFSRLDNPLPFISPRLLRICNYWYLFLLNIMLLMHPSQLCFDYSMGCIDFIDNLTDGRIYLILLTLIITFFTIFHWIQSIGTHRMTVLSVGLLVIAYLPASNIFINVGFVIAERVLYLPSYGFSLLFVVLFEQYCHKLKKNLKDFAHFIAISILLLAIVKSLQRATEWRSEYELYKSGLSVCPSNPKILYNLGKISARRGDSKDAEVYYRNAIKFEPRFSYALNNLANIYISKGDFEEAEKLLRKSVEEEPTFATAWMNLGIALLNRKKFEEAEICFQKGLKLRHNYADCLYNLGLLYSQQNKTSLAEETWINVTRMEPMHQLAWTNLLILLEEANRCPEAIKIGKKIIHQFPNNPSIHMQIGICYGKLREFEESEEHLLYAAQLLPKSSKCWTNLGVLYEKWGKVDKAEASYRRAIQNEFHSRKAITYLKNLKRKYK